MTQLLMRRPNLDNLPAVPDLPQGYVLREYRDGDLEGLAALLRAAFKDDVWTAEQAKEVLVDAPDVEKTFVVARNDVPVATASVRLLPERFPESGYVHWVAADPAEKGQRLGFVVTLAVLHAFRERGLKDAVLETDDHRLAAIETYQNLGFVPEHAHESHAERWARILSDLLAAANL